MGKVELFSGNNRIVTCHIDLIVLHCDYSTKAYTTSV